MATDPDTPNLDSVDLTYFTGGSKITSGELPALLKKAADRAAQRGAHVPIVAAGKATSSPGQGPQPVQFGSVYLLAFTLDIDDAFRQFKIPSQYVGNPQMHIHWTKTGDLDESGKVVKWQIQYLAFPGSGADINVAPSVVEYEDTYLDAGTTSRVLHRTPYIDLDPLLFQPGYYLSVKLQAVTPAGTPMASEPGLFSLDLTFTEQINT